MRGRVARIGRDVQDRFDDLRRADAERERRPDVDPERTFVDRAHRRERRTRGQLAHLWVERRSGEDVPIGMIDDHRTDVWATAEKLLTTSSPEPPEVALRVAIPRA